MSHATTVIKPGRSFLRELFTLLKATRASHHSVQLNTEAKADLCWWRYFLQDWNGVSFFSQPAYSYHIYSDAPSTYGSGAFSQSLGWFQVRWPACWEPVNIAAKELVPIVFAAAKGEHSGLGTLSAFIQTTWQLWPSWEKVLPQTGC